MHIVNTARLGESEYVSTFPPTAAEASTEVGADDVNAPVEALAYLLMYVFAILACIGAGSLWAYLS